jgi:hypothetical protein
VEIDGRTLRLTVDRGGDDIVQINPDSPAVAPLAVVGRRARRAAWRNVKPGADVLAGCAGIGRTREPAKLVLTCPAP